MYEANGGLGFVVKREGQYVVDVAARPLEQVLGYLREQAEYGETRNGRNLEERFADAPFGWDNETVRLVLAALLRAGRIVVTHNGRPYKSWQEPAVRPALTNLTAFRSSTFVPRTDEGPTLEEIGRAIGAFRDLTGDELEYDQEAIAKRFGEFAARSLQEARPVYAKRAGSGLPDDEDAQAYLSLLESVGSMDSEDAVRSLATAGLSLRSGREAMRRIQHVVDDGAFDRVRLAQVAADRLWPLLRQAGCDDPGVTSRAEELVGMLTDARLYSHQYAVMAAGEEIARAYATTYEAAHRARSDRYAEVIEAVKSAPGWERLQPTEEAERQAQEANRRSVLGPLEVKACDRLDLPLGEVACRTCLASLGQLAADVEAVGPAEAAARERLRAILEPTKTRRTVRAGVVLRSVEIADEEGAREAVARLLDVILAELGDDVVVVVG